MQVLPVTVVKRPVSPVVEGAATFVRSMPDMFELEPLIPCANSGAATSRTLTKKKNRCLRRNKSHLLKFRTVFVRIV